jgi:cell wall-associated NlpC family hydrolase
MFRFLTFIAFYILININVVYATNDANRQQPAVTRPIPVATLVDYQNYSPTVKTLITHAALLADKNLTYQYGSADPKNGGMDCSGTMYYLLTEITHTGIPRSANDMYIWLVQEGKMHFVNSNDLSSSEFAQLKPGDLLFWSGTYATKQKSAISHVMLYIGKDKANKHLMFGSSDGRTYQGEKMWGVSVFDFVMPTEGRGGKFVGYGCVPSITC